MNERCSEDGGFIGEAGCTHPNHQHSELVKRITGAYSPTMITATEAEAALREGFYIDDPNGERIGFGSKLLSHIDSDTQHAPKDQKNPKERLMFAVDTVARPDKMETNHRLIPGRTAYAKSYADFGILAITQKDSGIIDTITYFPRRNMKRK